METLPACFEYEASIFSMHGVNHLWMHQGNKQLRRHWRTWVTEEDIAELATAGVNTIRLPVGDWMYQPYGPYLGCTDGALDEVDRLFDLCRRYIFWITCLLHPRHDIVAVLLIRITLLRSLLFDDHTAVSWSYNTAIDANVILRYGLRVLLDIHAVQGSQNGFDNSGQVSLQTEDMDILMSRSQAAVGLPDDTSILGALERTLVC